MKKIKFYLIILTSLFLIFGAAAAKEEVAGPKPDEALGKLIEGNKRYIESKPIHPDSSVERRTEVAKGQHPIAVIVGCSDSRVPPEIIFDQGLGDIFVVRVAGNIVDDMALGSIEYAAEHLESPLIVVLGHERCGAVDATVKGGEVPGHIANLVNAIKPALEKVTDKSGDLLEKVVKENVVMIVAQLKSSKPILTEMVEKGKIKIVGAYYDLDTGEVTLIP